MNRLCFCGFGLSAWVFDDDSLRVNYTSAVVKCPGLTRLVTLVPSYNKSLMPGIIPGHDRLVPSYNKSLMPGMTVPRGLVLVSKMCFVHTSGGRLGRNKILEET